jgi:hypothetical protein
MYARPKEGTFHQFQQRGKKTKRRNEKKSNCQCCNGEVGVTETTEKMSMLGGETCATLTAVL